MRPMTGLATSATHFTHTKTMIIAHHRLASNFTPHRRQSLFIAAPFVYQRRTHGVVVLAAAENKSTTSTSTITSTSTAKDCVENGLLRFESGDAQGALDLFNRALKLKPNDDEARAALYNSACALTKLQRWEEAAEAVVSAVNDRGLKLAVALRDPDLALLRERREWNAALNRAAGGITNNSYVKLRAEAKAPFRLTRIFLFGALAAGAGLGTIVITARLIAAVRGGEGAPELVETLQNFGINIGALTLLSFLVYRDLTAAQKDETIVEREETLATLQVALSSTRTVPLAAFRGTCRPIIITGSKGQINKTLAAAEPFRQELRLRGVSVVPVILSDEDPGEKLRRLKAELASEGGGGTSTSSSGGGGALANTAPAQGFGTSGGSGGDDNMVVKSGKKSTVAASVVGADGQVAKDDRRWQLQATNLPEWTRWVLSQAKNAGVSSPGDNYYVQIQLDGSVRASGTGLPPWRQFLDDIPPLDDVRTKLTDGGGSV